MGLDIGLAATFHHNRPMSIIPCEDCVRRYQKSGFGKSATVSYSTKISRLHAFRIGITFSEYQYEESGLVLSPANDLNGYAYIFDLDYQGLEIGYRLHWLNHNNLSIFFEHNFVLDHKFESSLELNEWNYSIKPRIGLSYSIADQLNVRVSGFYKNSIKRYNASHHQRAYRPYALGMEIGFDYIFLTKKMQHRIWRNHTRETLVILI